MNLSNFSEIVLSTKLDLPTTPRLAISDLCSVYIISPEGVPTTCKIGVTKNVSQRLRTLYASSAVPLALVCSKEFSTRERAYGLEKTLHTKFIRWRRGGTEWFDGIDVNAVVEALLHDAAASR
jgi:predicted GIY-YIG superfamily endonuclease